MRTPEEERMAALQSLGILDTPPEAIFDHITRLAALTFGTSIAIVSLVDVDRQWFKSCVGLDVSETDRDVAFCDHAIRQDEVMVVLDASLDPRFRENPLVTGAPSIRFYAGAPLLHASGARLGTLCIIHDKPRAGFDQQSRAQLAAMAATVTAAMSMRRDISTFLQIEEERAERQQLLAQVEAMAGVGHWSLDAASQQTVWSPAVYQIHGLEPGGPTPDYEQAIACYHPEDRGRVQAAVGASLELGAAFTFRARLLRTDGEVRHVKSHGEPRRNADGVITGLSGVFMDVSDVVAADEALRTNEARLQFMTENAADVILRISPGRGVTWASPNVRRYGYDPAMLLGKGAFIFVHPDDLDDLRTLEAARLAGRPATTGERSSFRFRTAEGAWVRFESNATIVRGADGAVDEVITVLRDVTEQHNVQSALAESETRYRLLADNASDLIACFDLRGRFTYLSPSVRTLLGYDVHELLGQPTSAVMHPEDHAASLAIYTEHLAGGRAAESFRFEYRAFRKDGAMIWLAGHPRAVFDPRGDLIGFQDVVRDVTERRQLEAELRAAREAADAAAQVKADFMANMSHEIRTPLTAILGFTSLLGARPELSSDARRSVDRISAAGQALLAIVNDVLDFSKLEAGEMPIRARPTSIEECLSDSLSLFEPQAAAKGLGLELICEGAPASAEFDPDRLRQILLNFVGNAVKFTETGKVTVWARHDAEAGTLRVEVRDTGAGMDEAQQARLFQRFSQVDGTSTRKHGGAGLGLAISRGLVEAMGGAVGVKSAPGAGSTFWLTIPAPACRPAAQPMDSACETFDLRGCRLMVADDNRVNRELVKALLLPFGAEVTEAVDGLEAIELASCEPFDLILMDVRMPRCDGPNATLHIRENAGPNQDIPILAFTADFDFERFGEHAARGFDGVVRKPLDRASLLAQVAEATTCECDEAPKEMRA
jgi:PAS domain S-box-containing protein